MNNKETLVKYRPLLIVIILFLLAFSLRAGAVNLSSVHNLDKAFYEDANGVPYFSEIDSYFNLRITQDYLNNGYIGDAVINNTNWDLHSYYPSGREAAYKPLIVYITASAYILVNLFVKVPLTTVAFWVPAFIGSLAVIPAYLFIRRITNDYGGITAAILVATAPAYFAHNFAGFFTTEMFNVLLPLIIVWLFIEAIRENNRINRIILTVLSTLFVFIYSIAWDGWIYIFYILVGSTIVYLIFSYFFQFETVKKRSKYENIGRWFIDQPIISTLIIFIILSVFFILVSVGPSNFLSTFLGPLGFNQLQASTLANSSYPNAYISVAGLAIPSVPEAITDSGGYVAFIFSLMGVFLLFWRLKSKNIKETGTSNKTMDHDKPQDKKKQRRGSRRRRNKNQQIKPKKSENKFVLPELKGKDKKNYLLYAILLSIWLLITAYSLTKGVRFALEFSIPLALGAGIFVGLMQNYVKGYIENPDYQKVFIIILVLAAIFSPVSSAYAISCGVVPGTDDYMVNSLNWIKNNTPQNTVITSWWDYGYLFEVTADRPVTFDGGTQNSPRAYWVGKALSTNNETLSAGIFKMLSNSGDLAPVTLDNYTKNTGKSVEILNNILGVDKSTALTIMTTRYNLTPQQAQNVVQYTHPDKPTSNVLITSDDMITKAGAWSYFGNWNFQSNNSTPYIYLQGRGVIVPNNETGLNNNTTIILANNAVFAQIIGNNVSSGIINVKQLQNQNISSTELINQLLTGLKGNNTLVVKPHRLIVMQNNNITQDDIISNDSEYSIIIINNNGNYTTYILNKELEDSMFTRLHILRGQGINQFMLNYEQPGVMIWKVT